MDQSKPVVRKAKRATAPIQGGPVSEGLDRIGSLPDESGIKGKEEANSNPPNRREPSPEGSIPAEGRIIEGTGELPVSATSGSPLWSAENVLQTIADRFTAARVLQKSEAWRQLQIDLMDASPFLVPHILPYKDLIAIVSDIEKEIKGGTGHQGKSNEEIMADFLSGEGTLVVAQASLEPALDKGGKIELDGGESSDDTPLSLAPDTPIPPPS